MEIPDILPTPNWFYEQAAKARKDNNRLLAYLLEELEKEYENDWQGKYEELQEQFEELERDYRNQASLLKEAENALNCLKNQLAFELSAKTPIKKLRERISTLINE